MNETQRSKDAMTLRSEDELSYEIIGAAIEVHRILGGPGLLEGIYESSLCHELILRGLPITQLLTYLRLTGIKLGLLINFGQACVKDGIHRIVNGL